MIRDIITGIKNLISWFPIIWKDRGWDQHYIFVMLRHKLINAEKEISNGLNVEADKVADKIKLCVMLLNRIIDRDYDGNADMPVAKKWGELIITCEDLAVIDIRREKAITDSDIKKSNKETRAASIHAGYMVAQDTEYLFKTMTKHIHGWWD
ncbi:MAG: hypothetical protein DRI61_10145 [Chloroflexi bacterium]|nr:MAG: hypothetical protein DRI61_10145 [Chloroflexota bacterium]